MVELADSEVSAVEVNSLVLALEQVLELELELVAGREPDVE